MKKIILLISFLSLSAFIANAQHTSKENPTSGPTFGPVNPPKTSDNVPANEECYCHFYSQHGDYLLYVNSVIGQLLAYEQEQWYEGQKDLLKEEMEERLDQEFATFEQAQLEFFKQSFANIHADIDLANALIADQNARAGKEILYNETFVPRKIFQFAQNNSNYDFQGLTRYNKRIEDMEFIEAQNHFNTYTTINIDHKVDWRYHNNRILNNPYVKNNQSYANLIAQQYINYVNSHGPYDRVTLMTGYLIYDWQNQPLVVVPPVQFGGVPFYYAYHHSAFLQAQMDNLINNGPNVGNDLQDPNYTFEQLRKMYSLRAEHIGNLASGFYEDKSMLSDEIAKYMEADDFGTSSKNTVQRLAEYFENDEPFMPDSYWTGQQAWGQDSDRPERLMNVRLSSQALNWGLQGFGHVMEALDLYPDLNEKLGELFKLYINPNSPSSVNLSMFSDEDLGKIFGFDWRGNDYLGLQFSSWALARILEIEHGDNVYGWSIFENQGKLWLLQNLVNDNDIDFTMSSFLSDLSFEQLEWWIHPNNQNQTEEILVFLDEENFSLEAKNLALSFIDVSRNNMIAGPYDSDYFNVLDQYSSIDMTDPALVARWIAHFSAQCAILKFENPEWSNSKVYWEASKEMVHIALDLGGMVPVVGEVCDLVNGIIYTIEGDGVNATLSFAAMIPITGWFATGAKYAKKTLELSNGTKTTLKWIVKANNLIDFGKRSQLRRVLGIPKGNTNRAHHVIPWEFNSNPMIQAAAKHANSWHPNSLLNGKSVEYFRHSGSHPVYNNWIQSKLTEMVQNGLHNNPEDAYNALKELADILKGIIEANPSVKINDLPLP